MTPRGSDLEKHYEKKTDWAMVMKLRAAVGDAEVERLREGIDSHTEFIYSRGYSKARMPNWATHTMVREGGQAGEEGAGRQSTISRYFQVSQLVSGVGFIDLHFS